MKPPRACAGIAYSPRLRLIGGFEISPPSLGGFHDSLATTQRGSCRIHPRLLRRRSDGNTARYPRGTRAQNMDRVVQYRRHRADERVLPPVPTRSVGGANDWLSSRG